MNQRESFGRRGDSPRIQAARRRVADAEQAIRRQHDFISRLDKSNTFLVSLARDVLRQHEDMLRMAQSHLEMEQSAEQRGQLVDPDARARRN